MRITLGKHDDVAGCQPCRRSSGDGSPTPAFGDHVVLDDVLCARHHVGRDLACGRRLGRPLVATADVVEDCAAQPDRAQDVGQRVAAHASLPCGVLIKRRGVLIKSITAYSPIRMREQI